MRPRSDADKKVPADIVFLQKDVAVSDGVDSLYEATNDFTPMRNYFNEFYAKYSSKKVRGKETSG